MHCPYFGGCLHFLHYAPIKSLTSTVPHNNSFSLLLSSKERHLSHACLLSIELPLYITNKTVNSWFPTLHAVFATIERFVPISLIYSSLMTVSGAKNTRSTSSRHKLTMCCEQSEPHLLLSHNLQYLSNLISQGMNVPKDS